MTPPAPRRITAPPSPKAARQKRRHRLTTLREKNRTPAETAELLDLLAYAVEHLLKDDED